MAGPAPRTRARILLQTGHHDGDEWLDALSAALPEADIARWPDVPAAVDYLVVWKPPAEVFARVPVVKAIFNLGAGVDALLNVPNLPPGVPVVRVEDAGMAEQMADYVLLAVLAAYRGADVYARQQAAGQWLQHPHRPGSGFGIGVLGLGVLGQVVAATVAAAGFPVAGWSRERRTVPGVSAFAGIGELPAFLARSQGLVCLLPSTPATRDLLDRERLSALPKGAHVVNVARGDILVDADLLALLDAGHLAGATLDVFRDEPLPADHPFWRHPRIVVTPHVSAITLVAESAAQIAAKIRRLESGLAVTGIVDRGRGY